MHNQHHHRVSRRGRQSNRRSLTGLTAALVAAAGIWLAAGPAFGHEEPCKTAAERADREITRGRMQAAGVGVQTLWIIGYDTAGQVTDSVIRLRNHYDRRGNIVEQVAYDGTDSTRMVSIYDDNNIWLGESSFHADTMIERDTFAYNGDGLVTRILSFDSYGAPVEALEYDYRPQEDLITVVKRVHGDSLAYTIRYRYEPGSAFGRLTEIVQTNGDGSLRTRVRNKYKGDLRVEKRVFGPDDRLTHAFSYRYVAERDIGSITKVTADSVVFRQAYSYDDRGVLLTITERDGANRVRTVYRYVYDYDGKGR